MNGGIRRMKLNISYIKRVLLSGSMTGALFPSQRNVQQDSYISAIKRICQNVDGLVGSPASLLRSSLLYCDLPVSTPIPQDVRALILKFFNQGARGASHLRSSLPFRGIVLSRALLKLYHSNCKCHSCILVPIA